MTCCVNPNCLNPKNPLEGKYCISCGSRLGSLRHYHPIKLLGEGGFGRTFLAVDKNSLSQARYAIKQLRGLENCHEQKSQKMIELFQREASHLTSLGNHSQIPTLLELFEHEQRLFQVQEYIEGMTLEEELQEQGVYNEVKIRQLLLDLLPVLQFIHQNNVIHRDIKPQNIIRRASDCKPVLIDFGIAKQLTQSTMKTGTMLFTRGFAPSEQLEGRVYPASDLYSLGVTCVYLMTKVNPIQIRNHKLFPWRNYLPSGTSLSKDLFQILDIMLQRNIRDRFQSAEEVLQALNLRPTEKFVYWLMGDMGGKVTIKVWNWLMGISPELNTEVEQSTNESEATNHLPLLATSQKKST